MLYTWSCQNQLILSAGQYEGRIRVLGRNADNGCGKASVFIKWLMHTYLCISLINYLNYTIFQYPGFCSRLWLVFFS